MPVWRFAHSKGNESGLEHDEFKQNGNYNKFGKSLFEDHVKRFQNICRLANTITCTNMRVFSMATASTFGEAGQG